jgi:integrative and conjugative element protein (TIGR02256 family)
MDNCEAWSGDNCYGLRLPSRVLEKTLALCRLAKNGETGGILVGYYSRDRDCAIVTDCSGPPTDSRSGKTFFYRGISGLQRWLKTLWKKDERRYYLGEWHFHPYASPDPSDTDITQIVRNAKDPGYNCPKPIMLIVGGDPNGVWSLYASVCIHGDNVLSLVEQRRRGNDTSTTTDKERTP